MKRIFVDDELTETTPAAFGRLCVETSAGTTSKRRFSPAAFGRLCVETILSSRIPLTKSQPPSGGCVLKLYLRG